ncbi:MAG: SpoIID/LytB domain-containing protein [Acidobacteria bacterium]|nr:SpoIID/LytB domain-containing protein [Acidobacteriota bacterium]
MQLLQTQPAITVGLVTSAREVRFKLEGEFELPDLTSWSSGEYVAAVQNGGVSIRTATGDPVCSDSQTTLKPRDPGRGRFTIRDVTIGIGFHWERKEDQTFDGVLKLEARPDGTLLVINRVPLESYVTSVIASEMSATSPLELLKAHAVISRSWLLAQLSPWKVDRRTPPAKNIPHEPAKADPSIIRWYSRTDHAEFDVCADDHCQRYQGVSKVISPRVFDGVAETRGLLLTHRDEVCDARFSKCCGGLTENYAAAWENVDIPYLRGIIDAAEPPAGFELPLTHPENARRWILGQPEAYCNSAEASVLKRALPGFDQETRDFFRWEVTYTQEEVRGLLQKRLGMDVGAVRRLEPLERGVSGRIITLQVIGEKSSATIGKELEIRRALSLSHLYSSAFVVETEGEGEVPVRFLLRGAGWGHGVGLCQIGAAVMAAGGKNYRQILGHYYRGTALFQLYE